MEFTTNPILRWISNVKEFGLEYAASRFYGLYGGKVKSNVDLQQQGRINLSIPVLGHGRRDGAGGFIPDTHLKMAYPSSIYAGQDHGIYFPPELEDLVYVSFDHGDHQVPRYHGSWWGNIDPAKSSSGSQLPAEFKTSGLPLRRGIKTKFGHGLIFSDDDTTPYVTLWSGKQLGPGQEALRKQQFVLSDKPGQAGIIAQSFYGHTIYLNDDEKTITISGLSPDPTGTLANSIKIEDTTGKITIKTKLQQMVTIDDATLSTSIATPGSVTVAGAAGVAIASGAGPPVVVAPPGASVETGAGAKISNFIGAVTETIGGVYTQVVAGASSQTVAGALTQNVAGVMTVTAASLNLTAALINFLGTMVVGNPLTARVLANDYLIDFVLNHQHPTAALGPPSTPLPTPISTIVTPGFPLPPITVLQYGSTALKAS